MNYIPDSDMCKAMASHMYDSESSASSVRGHLQTEIYTLNVIVTRRGWGGWLCVTLNIGSTS